VATQRDMESRRWKRFTRAVTDWTNWCILAGILLMVYGMAVIIQNDYANSKPINTDDDEGRVYHPTTIEKMLAHKYETHVRVVGYVMRAANEKDGDLHIDVCDSQDIKHFDREHCMVFECMPRMMCTPPGIGTCIEGIGVSRVDPRHKWPEIHPLEHWRECQ
jgi:hypothetical protein